LSAGTVTRGGNWLHDDQPTTIPDDHYFVMGDNRPHSSDSREWGLVPREKIVGKVFVCYAKCSKD
ncbi:MAG: signal peptidase I, partial [Candidatus Roizmanbacteria bacterium]|nr:signal peptidase I [Candidatus Roizmanbacteria bacterium]